MKNMIKLGSILFVICSISALALFMTNNITSPIIEERNEVANNEGRKIVLQEADDFELIEDLRSELVKEVYKGIKNDEIIGYTMKTTPKGYGGEIEIIVGISNDGKIMGINIGNNSETPGLGSKAKEPEFKNQYNDKSVNQLLSVVKSKPTNESEISAISGATITSQAVNSGVNACIELYNEKLSIDKGGL